MKISAKKSRDEPGDIDAGHLEVGHNERFEVVINHPALETDAQGVGHIVFSPRQARALANLLLKHADEALRAYRRWKVGGHGE